jgi:hypothetical protein
MSKEHESFIADHHSKRCEMIRVIVMSVFFGLLSLGIGVDGRAADADGSQLTIVSPMQGEVIRGDSVEVRYRLSKGAQATHVHCYLDGAYQRGFKGVLKGLTRGSHEIKLVTASHDHDALGTEAVVTIEVE